MAANEFHDHFVKEDRIEIEKEQADRSGSSRFEERSLSLTVVSGCRVMYAIERHRVNDRFGATRDAAADRIRKISVPMRVVTALRLAARVSLNCRRSFDCERNTIDLTKFSLWISARPFKGNIFLSGIM